VSVLVPESLLLIASSAHSHNKALHHSLGYEVHEMADSSQRAKQERWTEGEMLNFLHVTALSVNTPLF